MKAELERLIEIAESARVHNHYPAIDPQIILALLRVAETGAEHMAAYDAIVEYSELSMELEFNRAHRAFVEALDALADVVGRK